MEVARECTLELHQVCARRILTIERVALYKSAKVVELLPMIKGYGSWGDCITKAIEV